MQSTKTRVGRYEGGALLHGAARPRPWRAQDSLYHDQGKNTERPHAPSGVAAFMSAHSKTPYITPSMDFPSWKGYYGGTGGSSWDLS